MARRSSAAPALTAAEIAELVGGVLHGDGDLQVRAVREINTAGAGDLVFVVDTARLAQLTDCEAQVAIVPSSLAPEGASEAARAVILVEDPRAAIARVLVQLYPSPAIAAGVHPDASVAASARIADDAAVAASAVIDEGAEIGPRTVIGAGAYVGAGVRIGADTVLHSNVSLYEGTTLGDRVLLHAGVVIGADGFGFTRDASAQLKVPQVGGVQIGNDVEIGANACVDRGTLEATEIGDGTKIDNLVQIGHNCRIGRNCAISGLSGLAGSTVLEDGVIMGGNVGTAGHQVLGAGSMIAAQSGVHGDLAPGSVVAGSPHMSIRDWRRWVAARARVPDLIRRLRRLERRAGEPTEE